MVRNVKRVISIILIICLIASFSITGAFAAGEDYRGWAQSDSRWGSLPVGSSGSTVASIGCCVTSVTKLIIQAGLRNSDDFNIGTLVRWLNNNGGFTSDGGLYWGKPGECVSGWSNYGDVLGYGSYSSSSYNGQMIAWIRKGLHMLINVNSGGHWVAVDEAKSLATGQIYIMDSLSGAQNTDLTLASRYASFNAIHAYTGGSTPSGGTVTPDPGLSVKETITCKRTIKLPERVVNLYSNPTDTTRLIYFDYGPTVYSSRYAVMSDGSIMYEVGANHQGQVMKLWLKYESDMTVTKEHTYGSTQYESAHPHRGYRVCECGDKTYTGETTTRDDCSECGGEVKYAVEGGYLTFDKKTGTVTNCDSSVTKANIPHTIKGVTVTSIGGSAFDNCRSLTSMTIPDSVTSIGDSAFRYCTSLTSVTIPDSVTSIGDLAFQYCTSLTSVTIPDSVTSIGGSAFDGCRSLTSVAIPDGVTSIGDWTFSDCKSLTSVTIPDSVTSIGGRAFDGCRSLTSVAIPDGVTSIGD